MKTLLKLLWSSGSNDPYYITLIDNNKDTYDRVQRNAPRLNITTNTVVISTDICHIDKVTFSGFHESNVIHQWPMGQHPITSNLSPYHCLLILPDCRIIRLTRNL
ncbi:hypothetical protein WUBG_08905 [Wuchereria bancrofti]|uniref:Uncharacterized protein n=1 Tax=Wuchereria bancrofti TaxID=6293 RepID=J9EYF2_WUCBA|nr:hypothetical protein WUBG_08905 [Wuchereria bancrofti]VDM11137.1 unnamed protein product [Wuchereria bancrofti]